MRRCCGKRAVWAVEPCVACTPEVAHAVGDSLALCSGPRHRPCFFLFGDVCVYVCVRGTCCTFLSLPLSRLPRAFVNVDTDEIARAIPVTPAWVSYPTVGQTFSLPHPQLLATPVWWHRLQHQPPTSHAYSKTPSESPPTCASEWSHHRHLDSVRAWATALWCEKCKSYGPW